MGVTEESSWLEYVGVRDRGAASVVKGGEGAGYEGAERIGALVSVLRLWCSD